MCWTLPHSLLLWVMRISTKSILSTSFCKMRKWLKNIKQHVIWYRLPKWRTSLPPFLHTLCHRQRVLYAHPSSVQLLCPCFFYVVLLFLNISPLKQYLLPSHQSEPIHKQQFCKANRRPSRSVQRKGNNPLGFLLVACWSQRYMVI